MTSGKMNSTERRAVLSLSTIMGLRMIGLFMVLPLFSLYAQSLRGATPTLIGLGIGIYGLCQAILQIPFGALSDRFGRKPIIFAGLLIFILGSVVAGLAHSIYWIILGRALQGAGAVGSTLLAMMADLTSEHQRTKSMAIAGITIGFSFSLAMLLGPVLTKWLTVAQLFFVSALFGLIAICLLYSFTPTPQRSTWHRDTEPEWRGFIKLLISPDLAKLNIGILFLHALFTATFIALPISLFQFGHLATHRQWLFYLPTLLIAFIVSLVCIGFAERQQKIKPYFLGGIFILTIAEALFLITPSNLLFASCALCLFFCGFSLLEAFLPSLITRTAPVYRKGTALGIYSCSQFFGIFLGGILGGWLFGKFSFTGVYLFCIMLSLTWLLLAYQMRPPRFLVTQIWPLTPVQQQHWDQVAAKLHSLPGVVEAILVVEEGMAYLKVDRNTAKHPDFIHLKEQLQSE